MRYIDTAGPGPLTDEWLVVFANAFADAAARAELHRRHGQHIRGYVGRLAGRRRYPREDVEDAQQLTFFAVNEAIDGFDYCRWFLAGGHPFRSFLRLVARRRFLDRARRGAQVERRREPDERAAEVLAEAPDQRRGPHASSGLFAADSVPLATAEHHELSDQVRQALASLDVLQRRILHERLRGATWPTIAEVLGVSLATVERRWAALRERLKPLLARWVDA
jgi:RNA polymerase sigma factor (sigma-70 family)